MMKSRLISLLAHCVLLAGCVTGLVLLRGAMSLPDGLQWHFVLPFVLMGIYCVTVIVCDLLLRRRTARKSGRSRGGAKC